MKCRHCGLDPQSQSCSQRMDSPLTPALSPWARVKKSAFTLAEVLVTLGIIGIVAAMTLPMLAKNYQFYVRQQQFKKAYAALEIAVQKTQIDMGEGVKCFYLNDNYVYDNILECDWFFNELKENLKVIKYCENNALSSHCIPNSLRGAEKVYAEVQGGDDKVSAEKEYNKKCRGVSTDYLYKKTGIYLLNSGVYIAPYWFNKHHPLILVDVNGHNSPNKYGHDIFIFEFYKARGTESVFKLIPSNICHPIDIGGYYTKHFVEYLYGRNAEL